MRFAIISDIHNGPADSGFKFGVQRKLTYEAERLAAEFVDQMNSIDKPEFVVNLGDFIEDVNSKDIDLGYFKKTTQILAKLTMPLHHLLGNHDVRTISQEELAKLLGYEKMYYSFDHGEYHFIALGFQMIGNHTEDLADVRAILQPEQITWLKKDLSVATKKVIVFTHYPLADDDVRGNFWFQEDQSSATYRNNEAVRAIIEESGKVSAVISGHQHWNRLVVQNGIPYFVVTSLVENFRNDGTPSEAHTIVTLEENKIMIDVKGNDPATFIHKT